MSKAIRISHSIGETVYLRTDLDQLPRIIVRITASQAGAEYQLRQGDKDGTRHQACEIMREPKAKRTAGY